jgi:hypothetical protein
MKENPDYTRAKEEVDAKALTYRKYALQAGARYTQYEVDLAYSYLELAIKKLESIPQFIAEEL